MIKSIKRLLMYPLMGYLKYRKETNQELTHFCALVRENSSLFARRHNISCGSKFFASRPKWKFAPQQKLCLQTGKYLGRHWHHKYFLLSGDLDNRWAEGALGLISSQFSPVRSNFHMDNQERNTLAPSVLIALPSREAENVALVWPLTLRELSLTLFWS